METGETQATGKFWKGQLMVLAHEAHFPCYRDMTQDTEVPPSLLRHRGDGRLAIEPSLVYVCQAMSCQRKKQLQSTLQQWYGGGQTESVHGSMDHDVS